MAGIVRAPDDPHWRLVLKIAEALLIDGIYEAKLPSRAAQMRVDLQWSILEASRVFGLATDIQTKRQPRPHDKTVTITVRLDSSAQPVTSGRTRLESLLQAVNEEADNVLVPLQLSQAPARRRRRWR